MPIEALHGEHGVFLLPYSDMMVALISPAMPNPSQKGKKIASDEGEAVLHAFAPQLVAEPPEEESATPFTAVAGCRTGSLREARGRTCSRCGPGA